MDIGSNQSLAALIINNAVEYAFFTLDASGVITGWSPGAEKILGHSATDIVGEDFALLFTPSDRAAGHPGLELAKALQDGRAEDTRWHLRKGGERFWANGMTMRIIESDPPTLLKILRDETPAKRADEQRVLLLNELNHRIKNTLTIIQSITEQTLRAVNVDPASRAILNERLLALSQAHNVLTDANWAGADLETITRQALEIHVGHQGGRLRYDGPPVRLSPHQAVAVALALHELATNALKYGALSQEDGTVVVSWNLAHNGQGERHATLLWEERGGPPVALPERQGFGTRLIMRSFGEQSGGKARMTYAPEGVSCVLELPLSDEGAGAATDPP